MFICLILVLVRIHFGSISAPNQMEPEAFVFEPKLSEPRLLKISLPKYRSGGSFGIFGFRPTLVITNT